jgi:spore germination protein YaaH
MQVRALAAGMAAGIAALSSPCAASATPAPASASAVGSAPVAPGAGPAPLQAFVLADAPDSLVDLEAHASAIGLIYPTYFECESLTGRITGESTGAITAFARSRHIPVMPRFNCQDGPTVHLILTDPSVRALTLAHLVHIAESPAYAGLNLDFENDGAADSPALSSFVAVLARLLHAHGRRLSVDVVGVTRHSPALATGLYDDRALSAAADYVFVIAWGAHWEGSQPGPIAPLSFVAGVARYVASLPHADRFVLGAPMYGLDWPVGPEPSLQSRANALQYSNVLSLIGSTGAIPLRDRSVDEMTFAYTLDGVSHRVWYMDARAVVDRLRIARAHGLGVGVWRLGGEDQALWFSPFV